MSFKLWFLVVILTIFAAYSSALTFQSFLGTPYKISGPTIIGDYTPGTYLVLVGNQIHMFVNQNSLLLSSVSWILVGALVWRGRIRKTLLNNGFDYNVFLTMLKLKGGEKRLSILKSLEYPKHRKQLANELKMDWKAIDVHILTLMKQNLVREMVTLGNATYYIQTEKGKKFLHTIQQNNWLFRFSDRI